MFGSVHSGRKRRAEALLFRALVTRVGGMSRVAKGADCKSAGVRLRRFESCFPHHARPRCEHAAPMAVMERFAGIAQW